MLTLWICILYGLRQAKDQVNPEYMFVIIAGYMLKDRIKVRSCPHRALPGDFDVLRQSHKSRRVYVDRSGGRGICSQWQNGVG